MEICLQDRFPRDKCPSILAIKNKIRVGHNECCNCCCCKPPEFAAYKYIQPEIPKSFRPIRTYDKSDEPVEGCTTYKLSYWPNPPAVTKPFRPQGCLGIPDCPLTDDTTHKMSYLGNWGVKQQQKILPCIRNWFGRGPIEDKTTTKKDYPWKCGRKRNPIKYRGNLCLPRGHLEDDTTYKLSYWESTKCRDPIKSFKPIRTYEKSGDPLDDYTTYRLSFWRQEPQEKETHPWQKKLQYHQPTTPVEGNTTYKLSYWPHCEERVKPIKHQAYNNLLNRGCCFDDNTTHRLSYFGGCGDRPKPILPQGNLMFEDCPISHDTINKLSYFGNWAPKPEKPIIPCIRQNLGRGPVQGVTTTKCDYPWKCGGPEAPVLPRPHLELSPAPLESCTTNRLSYMPNCNECVMQSKSFKPLRVYKKSPEPMDLDTTMQLSYQPREGEKIEKWKPLKYQKPTTSLDDNTTYGLSFIPPGKLVPCCPGETCNVQEPCCPDPPKCSKPTCTQPLVADIKLPCISC